ncbi:hypothetical protein A946_02865 [Methylacidiphilum kamchatkense Kam1]|uniref:Uncharacterized protein n=1 Tax=Methylacidiphilum kamchatkense Kam1 TaxID=1202785 RepID=A0ABR4ZXT3_9BACT|nr:hypothetical protein A946_02865 [Methylacidiphilum kamchatkense Kam1]
MESRGKTYQAIHIHIGLPTSRIRVADPSASSAPNSFASFSQRQDVFPDTKPMPECHRKPDPSGSPCMASGSNPRLLEKNQRENE